MRNRNKRALPKPSHICHMLKSVRLYTKQKIITKLSFTHAD